MSIIIDVILAILILIFTILAYKKGFLASLLDFLGTIIAWILSIVLSNSIAKWIYSSFIKNAVIQYVSDKITESANTATESLLSSIPAFIKNAGGAIGIDFEGIISNSTGKEFGAAANAISDGIIEPVITILIRVIAVILLYIVFSFVIKLLVKLFKNINKIPLVGPLNKILGIIVGILKGSLIAAVVCIVISTIVDIAGGNLIIISREIINETILFKFFDQFNPIV